MGSEHSKSRTTPSKDTLKWRLSTSDVRTRSTSERKVRFAVPKPLQRSRSLDDMDSIRSGEEKATRTLDDDISKLVADILARRALEELQADEASLSRNLESQAEPSSENAVLDSETEEFLGEELPSEEPPLEDVEAYKHYKKVAYSLRRREVAIRATVSKMFDQENAESEEAQASGSETSSCTTSDVVPPTPASSPRTTRSPPLLSDVVAYKRYMKLRYQQQQQENKLLLVQMKFLQGRAASSEDMSPAFKRLTLNTESEGEESEGTPRELRPISPRRNVRFPSQSETSSVTTSEIYWI